MMCIRFVSLPHLDYSSKNMYFFQKMHAIYLYFNTPVVFGKYDIRPSNFVVFRVCNYIKEAKNEP